MMKSAVASRRSIEDAEEGVPMSLLPCPGELVPLMEDRPTSSLADTSASKTDGQDDRKDSYISPLNILNDLMLKDQPFLHSSENLVLVRWFLIEILRNLIQDIENRSDQDLIPVKKVQLLKNLWEEMTSFDRKIVGILLLEVLTRLQGATLPIWGPERSLKPVDRVLNILQKVSVLMRKTSNHHPLEVMDDNTLTRGQGAEAERQESVHPSSVNRKGCFISTLNILKEMLKVELTRWRSVAMRGVLKFFNELLVQLEEGVKNPSTMDNDLIPEKKEKHLRELWVGLIPLDRAYIRITLFAILSQLQRATMTMRVPDERSSSTTQVENIVQKLWELVMADRTPLDYILAVQKIVGNNIWRWNHLEKYRERITEEGVGRMEKVFNDIYWDLLPLNHLLLSSSIEQMVVRWPSLEHYDQGRDSNPDHLRRGISEADIQILTNIISSSSPLSIKWQHLALHGLLCELKERASNSQRRSSNGDDAADTDIESIMKALRKTSSLLGLETESSVTDANDADKTCSMFLIEYFDEEKFKDTGVKDIISTINQHVSLHHSLFRLSEEGAERATQFQDANITFGDCIGMFQEKTENLSLQLGEAELKKKLMSIEGLFFDPEKDMLKDMGQDKIIENMGRVAVIVPGDEKVKIADMLPYNPDNYILEHAIRAHRRTTEEELQAGVFDVFLLMLFPFLYMLDVITDCSVAYKHCSEANYLYFGLTLVFIFGPMLAEIIMNIYLKRRGYISTWKELFSRLHSLKLLPRAWRSVKFAINSRRKFHQDLCVLYEELNRARGDLSEELAEKLRRSEISLINAHSFAAMVENEQEQLFWKLHEALNESAPQLLLQLVIVLIQLGNGETVGLFTYIGILVSQASFAWTLHLIHYSEHYDGLVNNFKLLHRATDFFAHFLIVGCRFIALSMVMALYPLWCLVVAFFYLGFLSLYLYKYSSKRRVYWRLMTDSPLWMVYRLFTTPFQLRIWKMDKYDDLIFNIETLALALCWPFLLDAGHPLADNGWFITGTILILNFIALPFLLKGNERMFKKSENCEDHDPFPIISELIQDLQAGKTRVAHLFTRN